MKYVLLLVVLSVAVNLSFSATSRLEQIDIDQVLSNERILNGHIKCLLDKGSCTPEAAELKQKIPDALKTKCAECNPKQRSALKKAVNHIRQHKSADWAKISKKYDPNGQYKEDFEKFLNEN